MGDIVNPAGNSVQRVSSAPATRPATKKNVLGKKLTKWQILAAKHVYEDRLTDEQIAEAVGGSRSQLARWKRDPMFAAEVERLTKAYAARVIGTGIAVQANRVAERNRRHNELRFIQQERAKDPKLAAQPGGKSGHIIQTNTRVIEIEDVVTDAKGVQKIVPRRVALEEFAIDTSLLAALSQLEREQAIELADRSSKPIGGKSGQPMTARTIDEYFESMSPGELAQFIAEAEAVEAAESKIIETTAEAIPEAQLE